MVYLHRYFLIRSHFLNFTMFDISVDQYFYPAQNSDSSCRKRIDAMLNSLDEKDLQVVEATIQALKNARETEVK